MVRSAKIARPCSMWESPSSARLVRASLVMSVPSRVTWPDTEGMMPESASSSVVLPAPFVPRSTVT